MSRDYEHSRSSRYDSQQDDEHRRSHHRSRHESDRYNRSSRSSGFDAHHSRRVPSHGQDAIHQANLDLSLLNHPQYAHPPPVAYPPNYQGMSPMGPALTMPPIGYQSMTTPTNPYLADMQPQVSPMDRLQLPPEKITQTGIIPAAPYYDLPAGLIVPLIPPSRREYKSLDPSELRLPFPKFPDAQFLKMIDSYYQDDAPRRDDNGWDRSFIDSFLAQKEILASMNNSDTQ